MYIQPVQNNNPNFGIKISSQILQAADDFYIKKHHNHELFDKLYRKSKYMEDNFGFDEYTLTIKNSKVDGKRVLALYAVKEMNPKHPALIAVKENINKILERFQHLNEYELNNKLL